MTQVFRPRATFLFRSVFVVTALVLAGVVLAGMGAVRSDRAWGVGVAPEQPVPFRHDLHAGTLAIDCRYCHTTVEHAAYAGIPTADTCMGCHKEVWRGASVFAPVRGSADTGEPVVWTRVHDLPAHAYFHHGIHMSKGVGCATCHGAVDRMAAVAKAETLSMGWCLDCHRQAAATGTTAGTGGARLTDCSVCHR
ncbi:cytochrome c3 family protein [Azospirillum sp.]|uniref:cytochrome c3 family protein n=1 Tax=Azospirillum sp. TaxID=34012 RepID=UPI002D357D71|nr:cytochrome c3 family protein [Azospirillum sp.]HYD66246.1 cytochrome c3 family protein [Azospirillum sp.]